MNNLKLLKKAYLELSTRNKMLTALLLVILLIIGLEVL